MGTPVWISILFWQGTSSIDALGAEANYLLWELDSGPAAASSPKIDTLIACVALGVQSSRWASTCLLLVNVPFCKDPKSRAPCSSPRVHLSPKTDADANQTSWENYIRWAELYLILGISILQKVNSCLVWSFVGNRLSWSHTIWLKTPRIRFMSPYADMPAMVLHSHPLSDSLWFL